VVDVQKVIKRFKDIKELKLRERERRSGAEKNENSVGGGWEGFAPKHRTKKGGGRFNRWKGVSLKGRKSGFSQELGRSQGYRGGRWREGREGVTGRKFELTVGEKEANKTEYVGFTRKKWGTQRTKQLRSV